MAGASTSTDFGSKEDRVSYLKHVCGPAHAYQIPELLTIVSREEINELFEIFFARSELQHILRNRKLTAAQWRHMCL